MVHSYRKIEGNKAKAILSRINAGWSGSQFDTQRAAVHSRELPFLKGWCLIEASDATALPEKKCVAFDNGTEAIPLQYDENFIVEFCKARDLRIDQHMATEYLRFWLEYLRMGTERFILVESVDELPWREEPSPQARKSLGSAITPLTLIQSAPSHFMFKGCVLFRDAVFECTFEVTYNGQITITDRRVMVEELTVTDSFNGF